MLISGLNGAKFAHSCHNLFYTSSFFSFWIYLITLLSCFFSKGGRGKPSGAVGTARRYWDLSKGSRVTFHFPSSSHSQWSITDAWQTLPLCPQSESGLCSGGSQCLTETTDRGGQEGLQLYGGGEGAVCRSSWSKMTGVWFFPCKLSQNARPNDVFGRWSYIPNTAFFFSSVPGKCGGVSSFKRKVRWHRQAEEWAGRLLVWGRQSAVARGTLWNSQEFSGIFHQSLKGQGKMLCWHQSFWWYIYYSHPVVLFCTVAVL